MNNRQEQIQKLKNKIISLKAEVETHQKEVDRQIAFLNKAHKGKLPRATHRFAENIQKHIEFKLDVERELSRRRRELWELEDGVKN